MEPELTLDGCETNERNDVKASSARVRALDFKMGVLLTQLSCIMEALASCATPKYGLYDQ